jgi:putative ABC transport system ATP-binding protein
MTDPAFVRVQAVHKHYQRGSDKVDVLRNIDFAVAAGEFVALMGPSGSGKTTLLNLLGGLDRPSAGRIEVGAVEIESMSTGQLARWRAGHVGFVFQSYNLLDGMSARRNVELPLLLTHLSRKRRLEQVTVALRLVGLEHRAKHRPKELSGGEQQRLAIARVIVADPALLLCDEPTGDLDRETADQVLGLLQTLSRQHGKTIVMVTHDPLAARCAGRIVRLDKGRIVDPEADDVGMIREAGRAR